MRRFLILGIVLMILGGCLPIELDVSKDGKILIPRQEGFFVLDPTTGQAKKVADGAGKSPVFACFAPDAKQFLAVTQQGEGGGNMTFRLADLATGKTRDLYSASNCTYVSYSPAGSHFAVCRLSDKSSEHLDQNMPELIVVDVRGGNAKTLHTDVASLHRWSADGQSLYTVLLLEKEKESDNYGGELARINVADGKITRFCKLAGPDGMFFDVAPDGETLLFTAMTAVTMKDKLTIPKEGDDDELTLFQCDTTNGQVKMLRNQVKYAVYSPDGKHVLIGSDEKNSLLKLQIADASFAKTTSVSEKAAASTGGMGQTASIYPGWIDNSTVHYLAQVQAYGTAGKNLALMSATLAGKKKSLQPAVDAAAMK